MHLQSDVMQPLFSVILLGTAPATPVVHAGDLVLIDWSNTGSVEREREDRRCSRSKADARLKQKGRRKRRPS